MHQPVSGDIRGSGNNAAVTLVSHGYENIYERGFCNGLHQAGFSFTLISSDQTDYAGLRAGTRTLNLRGSQTNHRSSWRKAANMLRYHLALMVHTALQRPAVLHVIGLIEPPLLCGVVQGLWFRLCAGRYVLTVHDLERHDLATPLSRRLYSLAFRLASNLVVHTDRVRDELVAHHGITASRIVVMQHGLEPLVQPLTLPPPGRQPVPLRLLVFGKVMRYKGIDLLLQALEGLPFAVHLTIAGRSANDALTTELQAQVRAHPLAAVIQWDNAYVPESQIQTLFLQADALVLPYRRIDQSGVLFQALRFGLPVVAARVGSLADYVDQTIGECCEPDDVPSLQAALCRLAARYATSINRSEVRAAGPRYEWQRTVGALRAVYRSLPAEAPAP